jgi:hypothetical protein
MLGQVFEIPQRSESIYDSWFLIAEQSLLGANAHFQAHFKNQESEILFAFRLGLRRSLARLIAD